MKTSRGFTMVELLVVISIISILMAMLLPTLSKAREVTYIATCLNNLHQIGFGVAGYTGDWKNKIPPNGNRIDGSDSSHGAYQDFCKLGTNIRYISVPSHYCYMRMDNSTNGDTMWINGLGIVWACGNIPYTLAGAKVFWCPAERVARFDAVTPGLSLFGPGAYWNAGLAKRPFDILPSTNGAGSAGIWTAGTSYGYRAIGRINSPLNKGSWDYARNAALCASTDFCGNVYGGSIYWGSTSKPIFSHYRDNGGYRGLNRLWYDGHAKWLDDPNVAWRAGSPSGDTGLGNSGYFPAITPDDSVWPYFD